MLTPDCEKIWTNNLIGGTSNINDITVHNEFIYLTGYFKGTISIGSINLISEGDKDIFIAKCDTAGNLEWAIQEGGDHEDHGNSIKINSESEIIITGGFRDTLFLGNYTLISKGATDIFLIKYKSEGDMIWAKSAGGNINDQGMSADIDSDNNIYIAGMFFDTAYFDNSFIVASSSALEAYVAKYSNDGDLFWVKSYGHPYTDYFYSIVIGSNDDFYIGGFFHDASFNGPISRNCIAKFDSDGNNLWSVGRGISVYGVDVDENNNVYATGYAFGTVNIGNYIFYTDSTYFQGEWGYDADIVIFKLDQQGELKSIAHVDDFSPTFADQYGKSIMVYDTNNIYASGIFDGCGVFTGLDTLCQVGSFIGKLIFNDLGASVNFEPSSDFISVFPNPTKEFLIIRVSENIPLNLDIHIYNLFGQNILSQSLSKYCQTINLSDLRSGIYILIISNNNYSSEYKIIIEK